jgi:BASS family bile acid:Na+ symporter
MSMSTVLMMAGPLLASAAGLGWQVRKTILIEISIQNATLGITLAALISGQSEGFSTMVLPSAGYGIIMYVAALPFVL